MQDTRTPESGMGGSASTNDDATFAQPGTGYTGASGAGTAGSGATDSGTSGSSGESSGAHGKSNAFDELESKIEAALEDLRPKLRQMAEGVGDRVSAARESAQPKLDQMIAGMQPRIDSLLQKMQAGLDDIRRDLEERASRSRESASGGAAGEAPHITHSLPTGDATRSPSDPPLM